MYAAQQPAAPRAPFSQDRAENKLGPTKTAIVFVVVIGCFAVLWPKVFYPMMVGSANQHIQPSPIDRQSGCCDVISELDVATIKAMTELCGSIIDQDTSDPPPKNQKEALLKCRQIVLDKCSIDISAVLQQQVRLGQSVKEIIGEVRSLNGSLCLKYNFGLAPWKLAVPHRIVSNPSVDTIRQERPPHLRSEMVHPAFRERGRAIPQPQSASLPPKPTPRMVTGRPGPIPGLRPTLGGAGHVVPTKQQSVGGTMGLIMPIYTIAIVIFFSYTVLKLFTKKKPETMAAHLYPQVEPDQQFRTQVFESRTHQQAPVLKRDGLSSKLVVNAMTALLDEVDEEIEARRKASQLAQEEPVKQNGKPSIPEEDQPSVQVLGLEVTASRENDRKWTRPDSPLLPNVSAAVAENLPPPQEIFLEGALPAQSQVLVAESSTEQEQDNDAVVLASKMTLSVISLDSSENGTDESSSDKKSEQMVIVGEDDLKSSKGSNSSHGSEDFEKIEADQLEDQINDIIEEAKHIMQVQTTHEPEETLQLKRKPEADNNTVNVEEIYEVEEIIEIEKKPVIVEIPVPSSADNESKDDKPDTVDKTKSSASSGTVEDIEELLDREDEVDAELNEQNEIGSEEVFDERQTDRISEERDDINALLEKYAGSDVDNEEQEEQIEDEEEVEVEEDEVVDEQEIVEYVDEEEDEELETEDLQK